MNVFISYSVDNTDIVKQIVNFIKPNMDAVFWWEDSKKLGEEDWPTIFEWIDDSNVVLAVVTDEAVKRAMSVGQEIGHAKAKDKKIIPIVGANIKSSDLGCLPNIIHYKLNAEDMPATLTTIKERLFE